MRQSDTLQWLHRRQRDQLLKGLASKHLVDALAMAGHGRRHQQGIGGGVQFEMLLRMRQRVMGYERCDVGKLGGLRSQKLFTRRRIKEEVANRDRGSQRQPGFFHADDLTAVNFENRTGGFFFRARFQMQARHRRDRRQRLAAKSQSRNGEQVVGVFDFRRGVAFESEHGIVAHHAAAVVGDLDQFLPARLHLNANARGTGVQRVLQQLLHHRRGTLHHLAGSDLVGNSLGENVNLAHGISESWSVASVTDS